MSPRNRPATARRGLVIIPVMICLLMVGLLAASLIRSSSARRVVAVADEHRAQADWIAHSALNRAAARLAADPGYRGESWTLTPPELDNRHGAVASIAAEGVAGSPGRWAVRVVADYPAGTPERARSSLRADVIIRANADTPKGGPAS